MKWLVSLCLTPTSKWSGRCPPCPAPGRRARLARDVRVVRRLAYATGIRLAGRTACAACGAATTSPWPDDEELARAYAGFYRPETGRFAGPGDGLLRRTRARLARRLDRLAPPGPVLDVGAGTAAHRRARPPWPGGEGLERDVRHPGCATAASSASTASGPPSSSGTRSSICPRRARRSAMPPGLLAPGGVVVVAVPNTASLQARAFGDRWFHLDLPRHLVHLSAAALLRRLERPASRSCAAHACRGGQILFGWLHGLVGSLPGGRASTRRCAARRRGSAPTEPRGRRAGGRPPVAARLSSGLRRREVGAGRPAPSTSRRAVAEAPPSPRSSSSCLPATRRDPGADFGAIPQDAVDEIILVDDSSTDDTVRSPGSCLSSSIWHPHQVGYGGNQKTCYLQALQHDADVVVMLHPDGQYEPELIPRMIEPILAGEADLVLGSRLLSRARRWPPGCRAGSTSPTACSRASRTG